MPVPEKCPKCSGALPNLSALLDYYSDIGIGHATILVALTFGLFSVLSLFESKNPLILLTVVYAGLLVGGLYEVLKFCFYLGVSSEILGDLGGYQYMKKVRKKDCKGKEEDIPLKYSDVPLYSENVHPVFQWLFRMLSSFTQCKLKMFIIVSTYIAIPTIAYISQII